MNEANQRTDFIYIPSPQDDELKSKSQLRKEYDNDPQRKEAKARARQDRQNERRQHKRMAVKEEIREEKLKKIAKKKTTVADFDSENKDGIAAIEWVASVIHQEKIVYTDAPSAVAWNLYLWVKSTVENLDDFWKSLYPKVLSSQVKRREDENSRKDAGQTIAMYDKILELQKNDNQMAG